MFAQCQCRFTAALGRLHSANAGFAAAHGRLRNANDGSASGNGVGADGNGHRARANGLRADRNDLDAAASGIEVPVQFQFRDVAAICEPHSSNVTWTQILPRIHKFQTLLERENSCPPL